MRATSTSTPTPWAKYYTPELAKVKFHWKMTVNVHRNFPVKIHRESDNPFENTGDK